MAPSAMVAIINAPAATGRVMSAQTVAANRHSTPHARASKPACGASQIAAARTSGTSQRQAAVIRPADVTPAYAVALHADPIAASVDEARLMTRVRRRFIPLTFICYVVAYLDRVNVGFVAGDLQRDLGLSATTY